MFKSALISLLLTFTFSNAQFIPASTGGFYDLRGSPTALPGLSATGIELSITGVESEHKINYLRPMQRRLLEVSTFEPIFFTFGRHLFLFKDNSSLNIKFYIFN